MLVNVNEGTNKKQVKDDIVLYRLPRKAPLIKGGFAKFPLRMWSTRVNFGPARALKPWADAPSGRAGTKTDTPYPDISAELSGVLGVPNQTK